MGLARLEFIERDAQGIHPGVAALAHIALGAVAVFDRMSCGAVFGDQAFGVRMRFVGRIVNGMQEGVLLTGTDGNVVLLNTSLRQMLLLGADAPGRSPSDVLENDEIAELIQRASDRQLTASAEIELGGLKPRRLLVRAVPLLDEPRGVLAVFVDVTEIRWCCW